MPTPSSPSAAFSRLYAGCAQLLLSPTEHIREGLVDGWLLDGLRNSAAQVGSPDLGAAIDGASAAWTENPQLELKGLKDQYEATFGQASTRERPPYELMYCQVTEFSEPQALADISGFYRAFSLNISPGVHDRLDHVGVEAEFLAYLCCLEGFARDNNLKEQLAISEEAITGFLRDHLGTFARAFARRVAKTAPRTVYREVPTILAEVIEAHCARNGLLPRERQFIGLTSEDAIPPEEVRP
jgi:TorA maturation chaperone TorD